MRAAHLGAGVPDVPLDLVNRVRPVGHSAQVQPLKHHLVLGEGSCDRDSKKQMSVDRRLPRSPQANARGRQWARGTRAGAGVNSGILVAVTLPCEQTYPTLVGVKKPTHSRGHSCGRVAHTACQHLKTNPESVVVSWPTPER